MKTATVPMAAITPEVLMVTIEWYKIISNSHNNKVVYDSAINHRKHRNDKTENNGNNRNNIIINDIK